MPKTNDQANPVDASSHRVRVASGLPLLPANHVHGAAPVNLDLPDAFRRHEGDDLEKWQLRDEEDRFDWRGWLLLFVIAAIVIGIPR